MAYDKFTVLTSTVVPMRTENVDTDQIIPARFLKATEREGFGDNLFRDWRYDVEGNPKKDFVLNDPTYSGKILLAGKNFGSGSSREHAVWAIYDYGFRCVVSSFFADIFKNNCLNIGVLPVTISPEFAEILFQAVETDPKSEVEIDIDKQRITLLKTGQSETFDINSYKKENMKNGFDDIDYLLNIKAEIADFAKGRERLLNA
ncbi:3-isopropylmalate dehydratase small subunit [Mariniradius saccharolyticus AK6]|jgi:3-isopropylmalate/(R)-2-methylmalate dehydratase small subunit|uniref:3-isopropylmalate dehydratase small subunit n=2 Tax=Mariniradius TaxID=1245590 RepID=M7XIP8_9BACT|nr:MULTISPECIES: 3-isopropylmalate dehydratase small subunit [Mariniradius]EMS34719.1 3-isopropylmalate dehydratase small subunit [Mariniradius saccharolyticus AK6]MCF1750532.1 3-isopropylmalate dehydratase small subunit [Mariniradius sediminis]